MLTFSIHQHSKHDEQFKFQVLSSDKKLSELWMFLFLAVKMSNLNIIVAIASKQCMSAETQGVPSVRFVIFYVGTFFITYTQLHPGYKHSLLTVTHLD